MTYLLFPLCSSQLQSGQHQHEFDVELAGLGLSEWDLLPGSDPDIGDRGQTCVFDLNFTNPSIKQVVPFANSLTYGIS